MRLCLIAIFLFSKSFAWSQDLSLYRAKMFITLELNLPYRYLSPADPNSDSAYPLLIFLYGSNARGFDNESQLDIGGRFFLRDSIRSRYPAFVLFPQCPGSETWAGFDVKQEEGKAPVLNFPFDSKPTVVTGVLLRLIDSLMTADRIDPKRIYLVGYSQGAMGVLDLLARRPALFAAGVSICGAGKPSTAKRFAGQASLWLFHGADDDVIPSSFSLSYYKFLRKLGADVLFTEYPSVKHNSWVNALSEPALCHWLFSKKKG